MRRIASLAAGLAVLTAALALPASAPAAAPGPCDGEPALYTLAGQSPAAFQRDLAPTYYEVGFGGATYGPGPGLPVPWPRVAAWVRGHPVQDLMACGVNQGWALSMLRVRGGYAYVMLSPAGRVAKLYLSATPLAWD